MTKRKHGRPAVQHSYSCTPQHRGTAGTFSCSRQKRGKKASWPILSQKSRYACAMAWCRMRFALRHPSKNQKAAGCMWWLWFDLELQVWGDGWRCRPGETCCLFLVAYQLYRLTVSYCVLHSAGFPPSCNTEDWDNHTSFFSCTSRAHRSDKAKMLQQLNSRLIIINN